MNPEDVAKKIEELEKRVKELEARPVWVWYPVTVPAYPTYPTYPVYPTYTYTVTCQTNGSQTY